MARKKNKQFKGKRHKLLFYKHSMDRMWKILLVLGIFLVSLWFFGAMPLPGQAPSLMYLGLFYVGSFTEKAIMGATAFSFLLMILILFIRNMAFVQVLHNHVRIVMPFFRMKIPYQRIGQVKPTDLNLLYTRKKLKGGNKFLLPYFGKSVISMAIKKYTVSPTVMRMFLPKHFFLPQERGFLLVISSWMDFSTEFDSAYANFREANKRNKNKSSMRGLY